MDAKAAEPEAKEEAVEEKKEGNKLVHTCPNLSKLVQTCLNLSKLV